MYDSFWLIGKDTQPVFFNSEEEVWDKVAEINATGKGISPDVHAALNGLVAGIIQRRAESDYHPLDYPIARYFLLGDLHQAHLPYVFHPDFLASVRKSWGDDLVRQFLSELCPENPADFFIRTYALRAVCKCSEYLEKIGAVIRDFHMPCPEFDGSRNPVDVLVTLGGAVWSCEVKYLLDPDVNMWCMANTLAGMLCLMPKGDGLRKYCRITLEGENIDDSFRKTVIGFIRSHIRVAKCCYRGSIINIHHPTEIVILKLRGHVRHIVGAIRHPPPM